MATRHGARCLCAEPFSAPWYRDGESARFYAEWVEKAVYGTFDHACLLALDNEGNPQGFVTLRRQVDGSARIGLLAVDGASFRGGVGRRWSRRRRRGVTHSACPGCTWQPR